MKNLRILCETGLGRGVKFFYDDTQIKPCVSSLVMSVNGVDTVVECKLELQMVPFDISGQGKFQTADPKTGQMKTVSKIIFEDGSESEF